MKKVKIIIFWAKALSDDINVKDLLIQYFEQGYILARIENDFAFCDFGIILKSDYFTIKNKITFKIIVMYIFFAVSLFSLFIVSLILFLWMLSI